MNWELEAAIELGRTLRDKALAEYEEEERQREYRRRQEIMKMWVPYIAAAKTKVPEWATIIAPQDDEPSFRSGTYDDRQYRPMMVHVGENIPPLRAWTDCSTRDDGTPSVIFAAGEWTLYCREDTSEWIVTTQYGHGNYARTSHSISQAPRDGFYLALADAAEEADRCQELADEAARRNDEKKNKREMEKIEKETGTAPLPADPMERIADYLERVTFLYEQHHRF